MTTASKAFKEYLHTRTKPVSVFDVSQLPEPYRSRYELYLEATRLNLVRYIETHRLDVDPERVHVGFVAHPRLNAWAVEPNGFHFIGINAALPCLVDHGACAHTRTAKYRPCPDQDRSRLVVTSQSELGVGGRGCRF